MICWGRVLVPVFLDVSMVNVIVLFADRQTTLDPASANQRLKIGTFDGFSYDLCLFLYFLDFLIKVFYDEVFIFVEFLIAANAS